MNLYCFILFIWFFIFVLVAFMSSCLVQPLMINECTDDADIESLHGSDERAKRFKRFLFKNEKVQANIRRLIPIFDNKGLLD